MGEAKLRSKLGIKQGYRASPKRYRRASGLLWPSAALGHAVKSKCLECGVLTFVTAATSECFPCLRKQALETDERERAKKAAIAESLASTVPNTETPDPPATETP